MSHPTSPPDSTGSKVSRTPSFVKRLDHAALTSLALSARANLDGSISGLTCSVESQPFVGGYNVVYFLAFSDGARWLCRLPKMEWSPVFEQRLRVDLDCLSFIAQHTSIPVPIVYNYCTSTSNVLGRPYTFTSILPGTKLSDLWFNEKWFTEERRLRFWRSLAQNMSQLARFEFSDIGTPVCDAATGDFSVRSFLPTRANMEDKITSFPNPGPHHSVYAYLQTEIFKRTSEATHTVHICQLRPPFVLSHPDLNYQNILVDSEGNVTGIIDWDDILVGPRQTGCCRYPSWITRDWDPKMYLYYYDSKRQKWIDRSGLSGSTQSVDVTSEPQLSEEASTNADDPRPLTGPTGIPELDWPRRKHKGDDAPAVLQQFRDEYYAAMLAVAPEHAPVTRNSHILEALEIAIWEQMLRDAIGVKLDEYIFGPRIPGDPQPFIRMAQLVSTGGWIQDRVGREKVQASGKYV